MSKRQLYSLYTALKSILEPEAEPEDLGDVRKIYKDQERSDLHATGLLEISDLCQTTVACKPVLLGLDLESQSLANWAIGEIQTRWRTTSIPDTCYPCRL